MRFYTLAVLSGLLIAGLAAATLPTTPAAMNGGSVSIATSQHSTQPEHYFVAAAPATALPYRGSGRRTVSVDC